MSLAVTFRFEEVAKTGIELRGAFGFQGVEDMHGGFKTFGPGGLHRSRPTLMGNLQVIGQGGMKAGFNRGEGHTGKIEKG